MKKRNHVPKYTVTALIICIYALLTGKPFNEIFHSEEPAVTQETMASEEAASLEETDSKEAVLTEYTFRSGNHLEDHYQRHGLEMGFDSAEEYQQAASRVVNDPDALHKLEAEDGDDVYYLERSNEFVILSKDGYIRTYFYPRDGIDYFNRQ